MKIKILGSGGFLPIPRAGCRCKICNQARRKGWPLKRHGPALFIEEISTLIDTPEDINDSLNFNKIEKIENIFYTHWHPDHTLGFRIVESLQENEFFTKKKKPINIHIPAYDFNNFKKFVPGLWYFETKGYIKIKKITPKGIQIKNILIKPVRLNNSTFSAYHLKQGKKQVLLCPDHSMDLPIKKEFQKIDILVMNMGFFEDNVKGAKILPANHRIRQFTGFDRDNLRIIKALNPNAVFFVHIEDKYNRTNSDLIKLQKKYQDYNIKFAVDAESINI